MKTKYRCKHCKRTATRLSTSATGWRHKRVTPDDPEWEMPCPYKPPHVEVDDS
jgi:hypothetical protein